MKPPSQGWTAKKGAMWTLLLLPFIGLAVPALYARSEPALFGFPFFYWYQFAWLFATSLLTALVYRLTR